MIAKTDAAGSGDRIATLDIVRGVAVMGILAMNILGFALPGAAYVNPMAYGAEGPADIISWVVSFIFIDGKMRGLFSFLFGASTLLVVEGAEAAGRSPIFTHYSRMFWLLVFGAAHFYLVWWGDILTLYAPIGMIAYLFRHLAPRLLIAIAAGLILLQCLIFSQFALELIGAARAATETAPTAEAIQHWADMQNGLGPYPAADLQNVLALYRGPWIGIVREAIADNLWEPVTALMQFGAETLGYMLLGMAALKSGFLTGAWPDRLYVRTMAIGFGIGIPAYAVLAWLVLRAHFEVPTLVAASIAAAVPFRPAMIFAIAALIILLTRPGGALVDRIAAAGRAAFTNYLGTSLIMTGLFYGYGFGLFGTMRRVELWIPVVAMWALMLLWSKPWLDRFRYGPFEWLWRSLSRFKIQKLRR
jgi:uncharacterized protein